MSTAVEAEYLDTKQAATFLGLSPYTLQSWRSRGMGPPHYPVSGTRVHYKKAELEAWMQQRRKVPAAMQLAQAGA